MRIGLYIPCFNAAGTIRACLEAVFKQTLQPQEVLVVDDGSSDGTSREASAFPVKIVRHEVNMGLAASRNTAVNALDTELVASLDADCIPEPEWLMHLMEALSSSGAAGSGGRLLESCSSSVFDSWRLAHMKQEWGEEKTEPPFLFGANTLFRREDIVRAGMYDRELKNNYEDVDLCKRLKEQGHSLVYEPKAVAHHYKSDGFYSLFSTYWKWHFPYYQENKYYSSLERFSYKIKDNMGLANRYLEEDMRSGRHGLFYLDFLLALHHSWKDFEYFASRSGRKEARPKPLFLWLSFLDLDLFYHLQGDKKDLSTLLSGTESLLQNFFALEMLLFRHSQKMFKKEFRKMIYRDLLLSVYNTQDERLLEKVFLLNELCFDWSSLLKKTHPNLDMFFLKYMSVNFEHWLKELDRRFSNIAQMIELSAAKIKKTTFS